MKERSEWVSSIYRIRTSTSFQYKFEDWFLYLLKKYQIVKKSTFFMIYMLKNIKYKTQKREKNYRKREKSISTNLFIWGQNWRFNSSSIWRGGTHNKKYQQISRNDIVQKRPISWENGICIKEIWQGINALSFLMIKTEKSKTKFRRYI